MAEPTQIGMSLASPEEDELLDRNVLDEIGAPTKTRRRRVVQSSIVGAWRRICFRHRPCSLNCQAPDLNVVIAYYPLFVN